jgi:hypothetical protein
MADKGGDGWVITLNVRLSDPLTDVQQQALERMLLRVDIRSPQVARVHVLVEGLARQASVDRALRMCREALVGVDAWFERVDVFGVRNRDDGPWDPPGDSKSGRGS